MTTITFQHIDYTQKTRLLAYIKKENLKFEISEPEVKQPTNSFIKSIEELHAGKTHRLENIQNPIAEILQ